jgi:hypothetical protein
MMAIGPRYQQQRHESVLSILCYKGAMRELDSLQKSQVDTRADLTLRRLEPTTAPVRHNGCWRLTFAGLVLEVDPALAGRVTSYRLGSDEVLTGPDVHSDNWGSSFWLSPQDAWGWPPPAEIDTAAYTSSLDGKVLVLTGPPVAGGSIAGLAIRKYFSANAEQSVACIRYEVHNHSDRPREVAAWEITRVPRSNLQFFPEGAPGDVKKFQDVLPLDSSGGVAWLKYDPQHMDRDLLVGRDGAEGWLASARADLLFIKQFPEIIEGRPAAGEAEVLLFLNGQSAYVELEAQSAVRRLEPGQALAWSVRWYARRLPAGLSVRTGNPELVDFARSILID